MDEAYSPFAQASFLAEVSAYPDLLVMRTVWPSRANFILFRVNAGRGVEVFESLKGRGVLVKCLHGSSPLLEDCLRVTVGTSDENRAFLSALRAVL